MITSVNPSTARSRSLSDESREVSTQAFPDLEEARLVERLRARDEEAYEELVRRFGGRLLATARHFLPRAEDAQDAVQEAFLSAFRCLDRFRGGCRLSTWLHRIVVNAALMPLSRTIARASPRPGTTRHPWRNGRSPQRACSSPGRRANGSGRRSRPFPPRTARCSSCGTSRSFRPR